MNWIHMIQMVINDIEDHLLEDIKAEVLAKRLFISASYLQRAFRIVTGFSIADYIRNRRLSLAGEELVSGSDKILDIALKYGYESCESFTKAFTRFHQTTPSSVRKGICKLNYFSALNISIHVEGGFIMSRCLIPNVERLYETKSENYMFPSCMRSAMSVLQEDDTYDFCFFAGVCGDLFTQIWLEPKWRYNDSFSNVCKETQIPIRNAFEACGYDYTYITAEEIKKDQTSYIRRIMKSIDKGLPVLSFGIVGPPVCSIICGYAQQGEILIGWSQFSGEIEEDKLPDHVFSEHYFQVEHGLDQSEALIFFEKKKAMPPLSESIRSSILKIPELASMKSTDTILFGKDAFYAWADSLLCDEYFQSEEMLEGAFDTYQSCVVQTGTNMFYMQTYLDKALHACPELSSHIKKLSTLYAKEKEAFEDVIEFQGGYFFERDRKALLNKEFRTTLAQKIRIVGDLYEKASMLK